MAIAELSIVSYGPLYTYFMKNQSVREENLSNISEKVS